MLQVLRNFSAQSDYKVNRLNIKFWANHLSNSHYGYYLILQASEEMRDQRNTSSDYFPL